MSAGGIRLGHPSQSSLASDLIDAKVAALTYDHVGTTLRHDSGAGRMYTRSLEVGTGESCFARAVDGLRQWACHPGIGASVYPADAPIEVGTALLVVLRAGPVSIVVPDRIVAVVDTPRAFGFAYGTLDGHQERGEESFVIERSADDRVRATIRVQAGPATTLAHLGSPILPALQRYAATRYLRALQRWVNTSGS